MTELLSHPLIIIICIFIGMIFIFFGFISCIIIIDEFFNSIRDLIDDVLDNLSFTIEDKFHYIETNFIPSMIAVIFLFIVFGVGFISLGIFILNLVW